MIAAVVKFLICVALAIDAVGSYRQLDDKWTAFEEVVIWTFITAKILAIVWLCST